MSIITVSNLSKHYQADVRSGIEHISFSVEKGEVVAVIGESGSGKSTLLKSVYGLLKPDSGELLFEGSKIKGPDEQLVPGHPAMRMVTQDFSLNIYAKVYDNIASMLPNTDIKRKERRTLEVMEQLHIGHLREKKIVELSGGEQQRVAIARTLVADISVLLLDEPFSQVDAVVKNELRADLKRLAAETKLTILLVSHDPADGLFLGDKVLILKEGKLMQMGTPADVYNHPANIYTAKLLGNANVLDATAAAAVGIKSNTATVVFYPEWVSLGNTWNSRRFNVLDIYFKGFYEELLLERNGVKIRAIHTKCGAYNIGDAVQAGVAKSVDFTA